MQEKNLQHTPSDQFPWKNNPREKRPFYIGMTDEEISQALSTLKLTALEQLYQHLNSADLFTKEQTHSNFKPLPYDQLADHLQNLASKNILSTSFIGDGLAHYQPSPIIADICNIRGLTTAYTPYQPERSQGTLQTLWIYQSLLSELTGFEAINASLYDRSTCLFEALLTGLRLQDSTSKNVWVAQNLYPGDIEVLKTMSAHTDVNIEFIAEDPTTGKIDLKAIHEKYEAMKHAGKAPSVFAFPQVNQWGNLEDVDLLADFCTEKNIRSIAVIDPILVSNECLKPPSQYGSHAQGVDIFVAEGQHLGFDAMFGGPGLGIFGIRYHEQQKNAIRSTPGRFIGKAQDQDGKDCKVIVLSTREQHIRREKATSNICSNQSFIASAVGAALLHSGSIGVTEAAKAGRKWCLKALEQILRLAGVTLAFKQSAFWNEVTLKLDFSQTLPKAKTDGVQNLATLLQAARLERLEIGVDVSDRLVNGHEELLKISFSDRHNDPQIENLVAFFSKYFKTQSHFPMMPPIAAQLFRQHHCYWPAFSKEKILSYYQELGQQNLSPDEGIYPLGSCTMKYNPYINDWAAGLQNFASIHPQTHESFAQGNLALLYQMQKFFQEITGLSGVTTQPVAGAQGELVGLKLFQAYHADHHPQDIRNIILIPKSAHGTNPATASVAGLEIRLVNADHSGLIDVAHVTSLIAEIGNKLVGIMITNPNTTGVYETNFKQVSHLVHQAGGLVYMDGANMNAVAGWVNLGSIGVDAVHNNLHKTWTIPHGGGGPGDAIVAVSSKLVDYLPGLQVEKKGSYYQAVKAKKSIGSFHRHWGNFAHKVRAYCYIMALGFEGSQKMSAVAVLSARYLLKKLEHHFPTLPKAASPTTDQAQPRMHEFILTLPETTFQKCEKLGLTRPITITRVGKLFLDFGFHAPTVAFPEPLGLMIEPTESFTLKELDSFAQTVIHVGELIAEHPEILLTVPHFTPISRVDEVSANKNLVLSEKISAQLPPILSDKIQARVLKEMNYTELKEQILRAHRQKAH